MKDQELVQLLKDGKKQKHFNLLYKNFPAVKKFIISNNGNSDDACDIFQETLIILYRKIISDDFKLSSALNTYIYAIAKNLWHTELRRRNKKIELNPISEEDDELIKIESRYIKAEKALGKIGTKCKDLLTSFYHKQMSMQSIAEVLGISSAEAAKKQKYKCMQKAKSVYQSL